MRKEFQKSLCLSEIVLGQRAMCAPSREGGGRRLVGEDVVYSGGGGGGSPVGADD